MIPTDREELDILAGEFVLGLLDATQGREVTDALAGIVAWQDAVTFWNRSSIRFRRSLLRPIRLPAHGKRSWRAPSRQSPPRPHHGTPRLHGNGQPGLLPLQPPHSLFTWRCPLQHRPSSPGCIRRASKPRTGLPRLVQRACIWRPFHSRSRHGACLRTLGHRQKARLETARTGRHSPERKFPAGRGPHRTLDRAQHSRSASSRREAPPRGSPTGPVVFVGVLRAS